MKYIESCGWHGHKWRFLDYGCDFYIPVYSFHFGKEMITDAFGPRLTRKLYEATFIIHWFRLRWDFRLRLKRMVEKGILRYLLKKLMRVNIGNH